MIKVLFICLGNICRSPLAEAILNAKVEANGLKDKVIADSCGTSDFHIGEVPDERTLACAAKHQIPIQHRGRQLHRSDFKNFDFLIAMDSSNYENSLKVANKYKIKADNLRLMSDFSSNGSFRDIPDPYYGGQEGFEQVYCILDESIDKLLEELKKDPRVNE